MKPPQVLQEIGKMRFEEAYEGWSEGRLTQAEAARILGVSLRFRRIAIAATTSRQGYEYIVMPDDNLAVFHGSRKLADYDREERNLHNH